MEDNLESSLRVPCLERGLDEGWIDFERNQAADEIERLEAKLARAVEALNFIALLHDSKAAKDALRDLDY